MRLVNFLNEEAKSSDKVIKILKKDCKKFINEFLHKAPVVVTRIIFGDKWETIKILGIVKFTSRTDRIPKDLPQQWHDYFDRQLKHIFGWKPRSEGVFTYVSKSTNEKSYWRDRTFFFFPIGNYKYVWSPKVSDLYLSYEDNFGEDVDIAEELVKTYQDIRGWEAVNKSEVMFKCSSYYMVDLWYLEALKEAKIIL